jgi:hypothetical protein
MQGTELLVHQATGTCADGFQIQAVIIEDLLNLFGLGVVVEQLNRTVAIG